MKSRISFAIFLVSVLMVGCGPSKEESKHLQSAIAASNLVSSLQTENERLNDSIKRLKLELQAKEGELQESKREILTLKESAEKRDEELRSSTKRSGVLRRKQDDWQNLNKAYFIAKGMDKELANSENHDEKNSSNNKWVLLYDKKRNEIEELLSLVSTFPELSSQMEALLKDLNSLGKRYANFFYWNYKYYEVDRVLSREEVMKIYKAGFDEARVELQKVGKALEANLAEFDNGLKAAKRELEK